MRKFVLFLLTICVIGTSCTKQVKVPLSYDVSNDPQTTGVLDIYVPDTATYDMAVLVKFLTGATTDSVKLSLSSMPANITVTPSTYGALPTYTEHFIFTTNGAALGKHPVTLTASVTGEVSKTYNFNIIVLPTNSANFFAGALTTHNACSASNYSYAITGIVEDTTAKNVLYINNFGGYGPEANARVEFDPYNGTINVPLQTIGNGVRLSGSGTYTPDSLVINYSGLTPGGVTDNCTATIAR